MVHNGLVCVIKRDPCPQEKENRRGILSIFVPEGNVSNTSLEQY
jgi:hypothetical protein